MFELHLDRRWLYFESWKSVFAAAASLVLQPSKPTRIVVSPMSDEWLREHASEPRHGDSL